MSLKILFLVSPEICSNDSVSSWPTSSMDFLISALRTASLLDFVIVCNRISSLSTPCENGLGYRKWTHIDGFSEAIVQFMRAHENSQEISLGS